VSTSSTIRADDYASGIVFPLNFNPFLVGEGIRAKDEIRTRDPDLGKVVLYQLSYFRIIVLPKFHRFDTAFPFW
jgi:hypothetical protein